MIRIHIVGCGRSGTTLFHHMMRAGFEIEGHCEFEMKFIREPEGAFRSYCSKRPHDLYYVGSLIDLNPDLWVVCLERDPRDVVVSKQKLRSDAYMVGLDEWKRSYRAARELRGHPRFRIVRYEDLVRRPDEIQKEIAAWLPFLPRKGAFSEFHREAQPAENANMALGGVRPVSDRSIGSWRGHKPRLAAELQVHGPISAELVEMGYEKDDAWLEELRGVSPDLGGTVVEKPPSPWRRFRTWVRTRLRRWKYAYRHRARRAEALRSGSTPA